MTDNDRIYLESLKRLIKIANEDFDKYDKQGKDYMATLTVGVVQGLELALEYFKQQTKHEN